MNIRNKIIILLVILLLVIIPLIIPGISGQGTSLHKVYALEQTDDPKVQLYFAAQNYIVGEKIKVIVQILDNKIRFNPTKALKLSRPILKDNDIESYKEAILPLKKLNNEYYIASLKTNADEFYPGDYQFSLSYSQPGKKVINVDKTIQVGKITITNLSLDFALLNNRGHSSASLYLDSTFSEAKDILVKITPRDNLLVKSEFIYPEVLKVEPGKDEYFVNLDMDPEVFSSKVALLENKDMKTKLDITLKTIDGQTIQRLAIPSHIEIGSYLGYHLEFFVMIITLLVILAIAGYHVWVNNQPAELFGTLLCLKSKNTKDYLPKDIWQLNKVKTREAMIGSATKALIHLPHLKQEEALLLARGKKKNATLWLVPALGANITINNKPVTEEIKLEPGNELNIDGYLLNWKD